MKMHRPQNADNKQIDLMQFDFIQLTINSDTNQIKQISTDESMTDIRYPCCGADAFTPILLFSHCRNVYAFDKANFYVDSQLTSYNENFDPTDPFFSRTPLHADSELEYNTRDLLHYNHEDYQILPDLIARIRYWGGEITSITYDKVRSWQINLVYMKINRTIYYTQLSISKDGRLPKKLSAARKKFIQLTPTAIFIKAVYNGFFENNDFLCLTFANAGTNTKIFCDAHNQLGFNKNTPRPIFIDPDKLTVIERKFGYGNQIYESGIDNLKKDIKQLLNTIENFYVKTDQCQSGFFYHKEENSDHSQQPSKRFDKN